MNTSDITSAITAFKEALREDVVSNDTIAYRARICKGCPVRQKSFLAGMVAKALSKAPAELRDYACGICKCPLGLLLPAKKPHVDSEKERKRREKLNPRCWNL